MELEEAKEIIENEIDGCDVFDCKMCERDCTCDNSPCVEEGCQLAIAVDTVLQELDRLQKENEELLDSIIEQQKIIELMAKDIAENKLDEDICRQVKDPKKEECYAYIHDDNACSDCVIEYYKKKAKGE